MGRSQLERLSAADERILALEHGSVVGHWCKVVLLQGSLDVSRLRTLIGARIAAAPRLRQRLEFLPRGLGRPVWIDDPDFDLDWHVAPVDAGTGLDDAALRRLVASRMQERLDRRRPLWRLEVAPLADGRTALLWRVHHCMADGFTAMRIGAACIWGDEPVASKPTSSAGRVTDSRGALLAAAALDRLAAGSREVRSLARDVGAARHWRSGLARARGVAASARRELRAAPAASFFDAPLGRRRAVAWRVFPLGAVHDAAKRVGSSVTLNDAMVALVTSGVSASLAERGLESRPLRVRIPVSLHASGETAAGNRDSFVDVDVPLDGCDVVARLRAINRQTTARKLAHDAEHVDEVMRFMSALPFGAHLVALSDGAQHFSLCISNVVGPRQPVAVDGIPVDALHSIVEVARHHDVRASVISCGDRLSVAFCADADRVDPEPMMRGVDAAWAVLSRGPGVTAS